MTRSQEVTAAPLVEGDDTIEGSEGVDIIYIKRPKDMTSTTAAKVVVSQTQAMKEMIPLK